MTLLEISLLLNGSLFCLLAVAAWGLVRLFNRVERELLRYDRELAQLRREYAAARAAREHPRLESPDDADWWKEQP